MDFVIRKVNSHDLSNATHEETVRALTTAAEPIIVEISRRGLPPTSSSTDKELDSHGSVPPNSATKKISTSTQTDLPQTTCCCHQTFNFPLPPPLTSHDDELDLYSEAKELVCKDIEVTLHKTASNDKIGLTLCYGEPIEDEVYDVFVRSIDEHSLASQNKNIREGDLIVKINDQYVRNRQDAIQLFSENRSDIKLLLRRACLDVYSVEDEELEQQQFDDDDGFLDGSYYSYDSVSSSKSLIPHELPTMPLIAEELSEFEDDSTITDTATMASHKENDAKDSGVGHDSSHSSEQECDSSHYECLNHMDEPELPKELTETCSQFRKLLEARCLDASLQRSMEDLCEKFDKLHRDFQRSVPRMGTRVKPITNYDHDSLARSESQDTAYNTAAESYRSASLTLELKKSTHGSTLSLNVEPNNSDKLNQKVRRRTRKSERGSRKSVCSQSSNNDLDIAYTTEDKLAETIANQQTLLLQQTRTSTVKRESDREQQVCGGNATDTSNMEWVVKRRSDGSRYITRRPIRSRLLHDRKKKLEDERCGMTTDDDAMSELKTGRHWSKEDRRRHMQKAREYQQRKQYMQQHLESVKRAASQGQSSLIELSQQKVQKYAMKDLDFTTVHELMAHPGKFSLNTCKLFSVTTV